MREMHQEEFAAAVQPFAESQAGWLSFFWHDLLRGGGAFPGNMYDCTMYGCTLHVRFAGLVTACLAGSFAAAVFALFGSRSAFGGRQVSRLAFCTESLDGR